VNRETLKDKNKIVVKVGTSTLTFPNGRLNFQRIEALVKALSSIHEMGKKVVLVSSGSIAAGSGRLGLTKKPTELAKKQALAALGQAELIKIYQKFFEQYNKISAQVLLTRDVMVMPNRNKNAKNTLNTLIDMKIIPIINENDTISTDEIIFGDNDTLSANVATLIEADLLIMLSDINGLYSADPKTDPSASIISTVYEINKEIEELAKGEGTDFATGGMITKITAAKMCKEKNIDTVLINGNDPKNIFKVLQGIVIGTHFVAN
jgi:glutamate 5-kinase